MLVLLRRLLFLALIGAAAYFGFTRLQRSKQEAANGSERPDYFEPSPDGETANWTAPTRDECDPAHPIKVNINSGIYHMPGGRFYERMVPDRCYANEENAIADGYRAAKS